MEARLAAAHGLGVHPRPGIEVGDLAGSLGFIRGRVEMGDRVQAGHAVDEIVPGRGLVIADGADDPEAGDDDAAVVVGSTHIGGPSW